MSIVYSILLSSTLHRGHKGAPFLSVQNSPLVVIAVILTYVGALSILRLSSSLRAPPLTTFYSIYDYTNCPSEGVGAIHGAAQVNKYLRGTNAARSRK
jgi:hypothetical protein